MKTMLPFPSLAILSALPFLAFCLDPCPPCGNFSVPYPLSTSPNCGHPDYNLHCNNKVLEFKSVGGNYYKVLRIDPSSNRFIISPPSIDPYSCITSDLMHGGLQIDEKSSFNISNRNTVLLFNCSEDILLSPLNCSSESICRKFEGINDGVSCRKTLCCSYLKDSPSMSHRIRIRVGVCTAYTSIVAINEDEEPFSWNFGIELQWLPLALDSLASLQFAG